MAETTLGRQLEIQDKGSPDWDTAFNDLLTGWERGITTMLVAGMDIKTGHAVEASFSPGYARHCHGNSAQFYRPVGVALHSASSGNNVKVMAYGSLRSLSILSAAYTNVGSFVKVSASTPGLLIGNGEGSRTVVGIAIPNGILFMGPNWGFFA